MKIASKLVHSNTPVTLFRNRPYALRVTALTDVIPNPCAARVRNLLFKHSLGVIPKPALPPAQRSPATRTTHSVNPRSPSRKLNFLEDDRTPPGAVHGVDLGPAPSPRHLGRLRHRLRRLRPARHARRRHRRHLRLPGPKTLPLLCRHGFARLRPRQHPALSHRIRRRRNSLAQAHLRRALSAHSPLFRAA